jgi:Kdo2-lipid A phosphotransferase
MDIKKQDIPNYQWHTKKLLLSHAVILLLLMSWFFYFTHPFWEAADYYFYRFVSSFIEKDQFWQNFWAISNHSLTDWFHDIVVLFFFGAYIVKKSEKSVAKKIWEIIFFAILIGGSILLINRYLCLTVLHIQRKSPSMIYDFGTNLSQTVPWLKVKSSSITSYPGDHGSFAILFTMCVFHLMGFRAGILAFAYSIYWQLPRLVTGCHWFTDVIMGSFVISTFVMTWVIHTPLKEWITDLLSNLFKREKEKKVIQS